LSAAQAFDYPSSLLLLDHHPRISVAYIWFESMELFISIFETLFHFFMKQCCLFFLLVLLQLQHMVIFIIKILGLVFLRFTLVDKHDSQLEPPKLVQ
jgi:hypothetical protein